MKQAIIYIKHNNEATSIHVEQNIFIAWDNKNIIKKLLQKIQILILWNLLLQWYYVNKKHAQNRWKMICIGQNVDFNNQWLLNDEVTVRKLRKKIWMIFITNCSSLLFLRCTRYWKMMIPNDGCIIRFIHKPKVFSC